jgi:diguanylate cyclase (GGDEF)-like protein
MRLRTQIPTLLIPLTIIPLFVLGWVAYNQLRETSEQRVFGEMRASMEQLNVHLDTELNTAAANIELFAKHLLVKKYLLTEDEDQRYTLVLPPLLRLFRSYQEAFPEYYEIRVFLPDGYEDVRHTSTYIDNLTDEEAENPIFQELIRSADLSYATVFRNPDNQEISLFVGKPLILRDNSVDALATPPRLRGYLAITINLEHIAEHIRNDVIGQEGYLFATDAGGNVLFHSEAAVLGERVPRNLVDDLRDVQPDARPAKLLFNNRTSYLTKTKLHPKFHLFAVMPEDELLAITYKLAVVVATITLFTVLVTMFCLFAALEYLVVRPIHQLRNLSIRIGRGDWKFKSGVKLKNEIGELASSFEDMAINLKRSDEQVRYLAYHDSLTGLPNRDMFDEYLGHAIAHARRNAQRLAVLFLDIDDFKRVNDTLGHQSGDELLQEVAERVSKCVRESDYIGIAEDPGKASGVLARQGGDEFIILLTYIKHVHDPSVVAQRIIESLNRPITIKGHDCYTGASIGITLYPNDGEGADDLIKNADNAMYHAKDLGKNGFQYFQESMNTTVVESLAIEARLRKALENNQLALHYQAQVDSASGEVTGLEALLRWHDPAEGMIPPGVFIPIAERTGLIVPIGTWVLREACRQGAAWHNEGYPPVRVSVNISAVQFAREDVVDTIQRVLAESKFDPACLELEITESAIMANPKGTMDILADIKALGVSIALDDFGKGYSSLNYLRRFPIDTLKIDRSFIMDVDKNSEDEQIVAAIVAMAHAMNLRVVAEGVETQGQLRVVSENACDLIQGFLFSLPAPADQIFQHAQRRIIKIA